MQIFYMKKKRVRDSSVVVDPHAEIVSDSGSQQGTDEQQRIAQLAIEE
jgi:hypothetical protein